MYRLAAIFGDYRVTAPPPLPDVSLFEKYTLCDDPEDICDEQAVLFSVDSNAGALRGLLEEAAH